MVDVAATGRQQGAATGQVVGHCMDRWWVNGQVVGHWTGGGSLHGQVVGHWTGGGPLDWGGGALGSS